MDLPTYTSIWRIEKRLYKLYDFRLPMPLPIGQLTVFAAIAVPYVVLLTVLGLPFNHTLIWLYVLPPGVLTWLATRPVLESKRLPELVGSQLRYLAEPRVWCRMAPLAEKDVIVVTSRVWRHSRTDRRPATALATAPAIASAARRRWPAGVSRPRSAGRPAASPAGQAASRSAGTPARGLAGRPHSWTAGPSAARSAGPPARPTGPSRLTPAGGWPAGMASAPARSGGPAADSSAGPPATSGLVPPVPVRAGWPAPGAAGLVPQVPVRAGWPAPAAADLVPPAPARSASAGSSREGRPAAHPAAPAPAEADQADADQAAAPGAADATSAAPASAGPQRGVVTVVGAESGRAAPPAVERAIAGPSAHRGDARPGRVLVVPGGHRPGKPGQLQRDRSRAQLPIAGPSRIVVLGCTVGAGQTITTLLTGEVLASLRADQVAVLDLNPGERSLVQRAKVRPALNQAASLGSSRLEILGHGQVIGPGQDREADELAQARGPADDARAFELASTRYQLVLADPSTSVVPRLLAVADQLVLVAPASAAAAGAIAMTFEWLDAHGQASLSDAAIMVMNGVSRQTMPHVEQAERVAAGRCRAIVRVPWDDQLQNPAAKRIRPTTPGAAAGQHGAGQDGVARHGAGHHGAGQHGAGQQGAGQHWAGLLSPATAGAYTALAGVLAAALADLPSPSSGRHGHSGQSGQNGQAGR